MFENITIRKKMMLFILGMTLVTYVITLGYIGYNLKTKALDEGKRLADTHAFKKANDIKSVLNEDMAVARDMSMIVKDYTKMPRAERDTLRKNLMINILKGYPKYDAVWMSWDLWAIQEGYNKINGRERTNCYMRNGKINMSQEFANLDADPTSGVYYHLKTNISESEKLSEPYWYEDYDYGTGKTSGDSILGISPTVTIKIDGKFAGVIGTDMTLGDFQSMSKINFFESGYAFLLSNQGVVVAHQNSNYYSQPLDTLNFTNSIDINEVKGAIEEGKQFSILVYDESFGEDVYVSFAPIQIGRSLYPWSAGIIVPVSEITKSFDTTFQITVVVGLIGLFLLSTVVWRIANIITRSLDDSNKVLKELALGKLDGEHKLSIDSSDELGEIAHSVNVLVDELSQKAQFSKEIGEGNLNSNFKMASENDLLGHSLLKMRDNLKEVLDEVKEVVEEAGEGGNLSARIKSESKQGGWQDLSESVNNLLKSVSTPVMAVNEIVNAMAEGDLTKRFNGQSHGDLAKLSGNLNMALDNLNNLLQNISKNANIVDESSADMRVVSEEMSTNTKEIASAISEMSNGAQVQVSKVDESSTLIEGMLTSSNEMASKADTINNAASNVSKRSETGLEVMNKVVFNMNDITTYSSKTRESIQVLTERSAEITRVLSVITEIASQTNLLALNAAIEAAQAGDAGRGFAVVAEEIRKLAEDSRASAKEIELLVNGVHKDTQEAADIIETMNASVKNGSEASSEASNVFKQILESATANLGYSEEILNDTKLQISDINEVVAIIENVVVIAEQTAAGTEEVASSATELSSGMTGYTEKSQQLAKIAEDLKSGISKFMLSNENRIDSSND